MILIYVEPRALLGSQIRPFAYFINKFHNSHSPVRFPNEKSSHLSLGLHKDFFLEVNRPKPYLTSYQYALHGHVFSVSTKFIINKRQISSTSFWCHRPQQGVTVVCSAVLCQRSPLWDNENVRVAFVHFLNHYAR